MFPSQPLAHGSGLSSLNEALSDEEVALFKAERQQVQEQLDAIARMTRPQGHIQPTLSLAQFKLRKDLRAQLATYNTLLAPHKSLPSEVLSQIFISAFPSSTHIPIQQDQTPLVLCQICSRWRKVALATPDLWTDVTLRLPARGYSRMTPKAAIDITVQWFRRSEASQGSKLSLALSKQVPNNSDSEDEFDGAPVTPLPMSGSRSLQMALDRLVSPLAHRFVSLQLQLPSDLLAKFLMGSTLFPELRHISLTRENWAFSFEWVATPKSGPFIALRQSTSPRLIDLGLVGIDTVNIVPIQLLGVSWGTLTRLNMSSTGLLYPDPCYPILAKCGSLQECILGIHCEGPHIPMADGPLVVIPNLRVLSLKYEGTTPQPEDFFSRLTTPALKALKFGWPSHHGRCATFSKNPGSCPFLCFLKRSNCSLETFESDFPGDEEQVENLALAMPSLTTFRLEAPDKGGLFGSSLRLKVMQGTALPRLEALSVRVSGDSMPRILDMVEARSQDATTPAGNTRNKAPEGSGGDAGVALAKLRSLNLQHRRPIRPADWARIRALRREGIDVKISQLYEPADLYELT